MIYTDLQEIWPYADEVFVRWTTDGVNYTEKKVNQEELKALDFLGFAEWRPLEPPEWMKVSADDEA